MFSENIRLLVDGIIVVEIGDQGLVIGSGGALPAGRVHHRLFIIVLCVRLSATTALIADRLVEVSIRKGTSVIIEEGHAGNA